MSDPGPGSFGVRSSLDNPPKNHPQRRDLLKPQTDALLDHQRLQGSASETLLTSRTEGLPSSRLEASNSSAWSVLGERYKKAHPAMSQESILDGFARSATNAVQERAKGLVPDAIQQLGMT